MSMSSSMSSRTLEFLVSPTDEDRTFSLSLPSAEELNISEEEERSTAAAFVGCVSEAAQSDRGRRISVDHARTLILRPQTGSREQETAVLVGRSYQRLGDQIDELRRKAASEESVKDFVDACVHDQDSRRASDVAFQQFTNVVSLVVECDEHGHPTSLTVGRVASLFYFGYELCLAFLRHHGALEAFTGFLSRLLSYLIRFLAQAGFYNWLRSLGGWRNLSLPSTESYGSGMLHGLLIGTVAVIATVIVMRRFIRS